MKPKALSYFLLLLLTAACTGSGERMRMEQALTVADSMNRHYISLSASDTILTEAARYFDRHGTTNERLRAHYLLGCAYRDQGDAPSAIETWQTAIGGADTLSVDSLHNALLCRVYSQMADIFYYQNLTDNQLECLDYSVVSALACNDTTAALNSMLQKITAYSRKNMPDSVVSMYRHAHDFCFGKKEKCLLAGSAAAVASSLISLGRYAEAGECLQLYEKESGYVDSQGVVDKGREVYYYIKGLHLLSVNEDDSAYLYFRKALSYKNDINIQNAAAYGLAQFYKKAHQPDSALKYALYSYAMNDSAYAQMVSVEVEQVKQLHDYSVYQRQSLENMARAKREKQKVRWLCFILLCVIVGISMVFRRWRQRRHAMIHTYKEALYKLNTLQTEMLRLRSDKDEQAMLVLEKETKVDALQAEVAQLRKKLENRKVTAAIPIENTEIHKLLQDKACRGQNLSKEEWQELNQLVIECLPLLNAFLLDNSFQLSHKEYQCCLLLRLHVKPIDISHMFNVDPSYVSRLCKSAHTKLFGCSGVAKDLVDKLSRMR